VPQPPSREPPLARRTSSIVPPLARRTSSTEPPLARRTSSTEPPPALRTGSREPDAVKLATLTFTPYALPFRQPFQTARERLEVRRGFLVRVRDREGRVGLGEAAPIAGFGMESLAETQLALERWAQQLPGESLLLSEGPVLPLIAAHAEAAQTPAASHGLESALADLAAQRLGVPLHRWLLIALGAARSGAAVPETVAVNATLGALDPEAAGRSAAALVEQGFATLKVKVGVGSMQADGERVRAVRRAAPRVRLRVDANGAWSEAAALEWLRAHQSLDLEYAEQPLPPEDVAGMARLAAASPVPIAADEAVLSERDALRVLAARAAQVLVLKPMALAGPLATLYVSRSVLAAGAQVVLTTSLEGAIGRATALHTAAAVQAIAGDRPLPACGLATGALLREDLVLNPAVPLGGRLQVPRQPGLGIDLS
jgi:o-succinylbenzoate synthase